MYEQIVSRLSDLDTVRQWPEMRAILARAAAREPSDWRLPLLACEAIDGERGEAYPAAASIACLQISIILVDDMLDADSRGEYRRIGAPAAANLASAFQAAGLEALARSEARGNAQWEAYRILNRMMLSTAFVQHLDVQNPSNQAAYWRVVKWKSAPFFRAALQAGALLGRASQKVTNMIGQFGQLYGEMIQLHDDLNDTMAVPADPDWTLGRSPLPILFAQTVPHPERERFLELRRAVSDPKALAEAQIILMKCGAVSHTVDELVRRHQAAREVLADIPLSHCEGLEGLLEEVIEPVRKLFAASSEDQVLF